MFVFLIWIALLLIPLFKEVKFFGIELKQEIDSLKKEVREQIINLRSEIQTSISLQNRINITQNVLTGVSELPPTKEEGKLSSDTLRVLSTLWKHQKDYFGGEVTGKVWTFAVQVGSPNYPEYARGIGEGLRRGYIAISENGQAMLTVEGIKYCKNNEKDIVNILRKFFEGKIEIIYLFCSDIRLTSVPLNPKGQRRWNKERTKRHNTVLFGKLAEFV